MPDVEGVEGGTGDDQLTAGGHPARFFGGVGDDRLVGSDGDDELLGLGGSDTLIARGGEDTLNDGDDTPIVQDPTLPAAGNDRLDGGAGDDFFDSDRGADELIGGSGYDRAAFFRHIPAAPTAPLPGPPAPFQISLDDRANDGQRGAAEGDNVHSDIEELFTGSGDDVLTGSPGPDALYSQRGNDLIDPAGGADIVFAGVGDDSISAVDQTTDRLDCDQGDDRVHVDLPGAQPERADVTINCETITGVAIGAIGLPDGTPPVIRGLRATNRRFAVARPDTARSAAKAKRGTAFIFGLSEDARVKITIARKLNGRRRDGRCVAPRARSGPRCTRLIRASTLIRSNTHVGRNRVAYSGRTRGRALRRGHYRATVRAVDAAGNRSAPRSVTFTVVVSRPSPSTGLNGGRERPRA